jgi:hypothetical protein
MLFCVVARSLLGLPGSAGLEYCNITYVCTRVLYVFGARVLEYYDGTKYYQPTSRSSHSTTYYEPRSSCKS